MLLRDITGGKDPQVEAVIQVLAALDADVLLLVAVDWDARLATLDALAGRLSDAGVPYPNRLALRPNTGQPTGLDLDRNGLLGGARDAQGWGRFPGEGGMALFSRLPIDTESVRDFSALLWADLPGADLPPGMPAAERRIQRLSTTGHWAVPVVLPSGGHLTILAFAATPPVFDGPEDRNGRRNHDEAAFWLRLMDGSLTSLGWPPPDAPAVLMGTVNLDPADGDGSADALDRLRTGPFRDPLPRGTVRRQDSGQSGDPTLDTALFSATGGLRVDYVLPSPDLRISASGVLWPSDDAALAPALAAASRHRPVWVDLELP